MGNWKSDTKKGLIAYTHTIYVFHSLFGAKASIAYKQIEPCFVSDYDEFYTV